MNKIAVLKKRKDFVRVAKGFRKVMPTLILQAARSLSEEDCGPKVGYTTTKKIGKANFRNRVRRRLRAAVKEVFPKYAKNNIEYVLIGRTNTYFYRFDSLKNHLRIALQAATNEFKNE